MPDGCSPGQTSWRSPAQLIAAGLVPPNRAAALEAVAERYAIAIPPALQALIERADDPIGLQFVPDPAELEQAPHESADPIGDDAHSPLPGIVHRYPDRVLLKPLLTCPTYCRFCFRREHVGPGGGVLDAAQLDAALAYIAARPAIREVILTGGDPLMLSPRRLGDLLTRLAAIASVELLRIHTRVPVARPELLDDALAAQIARPPALFVVLHANHARELTPAAGSALARLQRHGVPVLAQTVLLRGVNDDVDSLADLFRALLRLRVKPYYLHQLDPAPGTARFHVPIPTGQALLVALRGRISGMALPHYVYDTPGGKVPIPPAESMPDSRL